MTEAEGAASIRLRYSRQFQQGGHAHTIDAETTLPVGASQERREQAIRELEAGVDQLARQVAQRGARVSSEAPARPVNTASKAPEAPASQPPLPRSAALAAQPTVPLPISESMPTTPGASRDRTITLPQFINAIKKHLDLSPEDAKEILGVSELSGLNFKEAYDTLRAARDAQNAPGASSTQNKGRIAQQPVVEAPRQTNRGAPGPRPSSGSPASNTAPINHVPGAAALKQEARPMPQAASGTSSALASLPESRQAAPAREPQPDFAGSSKAPIPIQIGVVRDLAPGPYGFAEEDDEDYELPLNEGENEHRLAAESKLEELKGYRSGNTVSPERLNVLNNVLDGQISEEQLTQIIKMAWGVTGKKKLKSSQVEALISWAKEDYFVDEVESLLVPSTEEDE